MDILVYWHVLSAEFTSDPIHRASSNANYGARGMNIWATGVQSTLPLCCIHEIVCDSNQTAGTPLPCSRNCDRLSAVSRALKSFLNVTQDRVLGQLAAP